MILAIYLTSVCVAIQYAALFVEIEPGWVIHLAKGFELIFFIRSLIAYDKTLDRIKELERKVNHDL